MLLDASLRIVHVVAGACALIVGPVAMWAPKKIGLHSRMGVAFFVAVTAVSLSGGTLAVLHWETRAPFLFIAIGTFACALLGYVAAKTRWRYWLLAHVIGQGSAYTAMVTAFIVANWDDFTGVSGTAVPAVFLVPMAIGTIMVAWVTYQVYVGNRPKRPRSHGTEAHPAGAARRSRQPAA